MQFAERIKSLVTHVLKRYGYRIERMIDYGNNQINVFDLLIDKLDPSRKDFFFVQVGANDGITGDPIRKTVVRYHCRGLLLEPQPNAFQQLVKNYATEPQLILENVALSRDAGWRKIYTVAGSSYLGSFNKDVLKRRVRNTATIQEIDVQAATYASLLERHAVKEVDLLVIDTEGFDYEIVKLTVGDNLPLPQLIRYEHLHLSTPDRYNCTQLLGSYGYKLLRDGTDTIAFKPR